MGNTQTLRIARRAAYRLAGWQVLVTVAVAALAALMDGQFAAASALTGGAIGMLAGLYQSLRMLRVDAGSDPQGFTRSVYVGELVKVALTVALFIAAIRVLRVDMLPTMVGYAATLAIYWVALGTNYPWLDAESTDPNAAV